MLVERGLNSLCELGQPSQFSHKKTHFADLDASFRFCIYGISHGWGGKKKKKQQRSIFMSSAWWSHPKLHHEISRLHQETFCFSLWSHSIGGAEKQSFSRNVQNLFTVTVSLRVSVHTQIHTSSLLPIRLHASVREFISLPSCKALFCPL